MCLQKAHIGRLSANQNVNQSLLIVMHTVAVGTGTVVVLGEEEEAEEEEEEKQRKEETDAQFRHCALTL